MHVPEGILPPVVTIPSYAVTVATTAYCLHKIKEQGDPREHIPKAALLSAAFFVLSTVQIPVPPASVHLILGGLMGVLLGYFAFPAILVALFFQAVMFGHGGLTTLGVNGIILGLPSLVAAFVFRKSRRSNEADAPARSAPAVGAGLLGATLSVLLFISFLYYSVPDHLDVAAERSATLLLGVAHLPVIVVEGVITGFIVMFLQRSKPQLLAGL